MGWLSDFLVSIWRFLLRIKPNEPVLMPIEETPVPHETPSIVHSIKWCGGTIAERREMYDLAMKICAEEGLDSLPSTLLPHYTLRADVLATIHGESGFNRWCENRTTFDYGLCQFSEHFYLKEYNMTPQYAIDHPDECIRIMARNFKSKRRENWVAYQVLQKMSKTALAAHYNTVFQTYA